MPDLSERTSIRILTFQWKRFVPRNVLGSLPWFLRFSILVSETQGSQQIRYPFMHGAWTKPRTLQNHMSIASRYRNGIRHICVYRLKFSPV